MSDPLAELRQLIAELSLISHTSGVSYDGKMSRDTSESIGGRRPTGGDREPKPFRPKSGAPEKEWDDWEEELADWEACYQRRTPDYFRREAERRGVGALEALVVEARETLEAWRRTPIPAGQEPAYGSAQWKRYIADSKEDAGVLATRFSCTRRYINMVRRQYRDAA